MFISYKKKINVYNHFLQRKIHFLNLFSTPHKRKYIYLFLFIQRKYIYLFVFIEIKYIYLFVFIEIKYIYLFELIDALRKWDFPAHTQKSTSDSF